MLAPYWERILSHLQEYDLALLNQDVLKGVYQQLIDPKDRHDLGEYYTPDWLCERIVSELFPDDGYKSVLDPSCGSGSFLRAAIAHFLGHNTDGTPLERLKAILANVKGIDIHPVAVTISRATYVLALGSLVNAARTAIQIPVYLADSLFLPREVEQDLVNRLSGVEISFGQRIDEKHVVMPHTLVHSPQLFDETIAACTAIAEDYAKDGKESKATLERHLAQVLPELAKMLEFERIVDALWEFTTNLCNLIQQRKDSIWSFIVRNSYRPAMFRQQIDLLIGNPPWLSYRYISDPDYQSEIKARAVHQYKIAPKSQKLFTQMELATVFLAHCIAVFARPGAKLGFVMPRAILSADQHQKLVKREYSSPFRIVSYWDLWGVAPLFNVPAAVLFVNRDPTRGHARDILPARLWSGKLPDRNVSWATARGFLDFSDHPARAIYLGQRAALSTESGAGSPTKPSRYQKVFKNGATIYPRNFYFVNLTGLDYPPDADRTYWAETDLQYAARAQKPWKDVRLANSIEGRFVYSSAIAKHVLPFVTLPPDTIIIPFLNDEGELVASTASELRSKGFRGIAKWMDEVEALWSVKREAKAGRMSALQWLDYQGKLSSQSLRHRFLVLYNAAGTNVSAAVFDRREHVLPFIVDHKLYWAAVSDPEEAHYLAAVLNSGAANAAIKPFQSAGLLGERDIHKKLLDLPIPIFDAKNQDHSKLAALGSAARADATLAIRVPSFPSNGSLAHQRGYIREALTERLSVINKIVQKVLKEGFSLSAAG